MSLVVTSYYQDHNYAVSYVITSHAFVPAGLGIRIASLTDHQGGAVMISRSHLDMPAYFSTTDLSNIVSNQPTPGTHKLHYLYRHNTHLFIDQRTHDCVPTIIYRRLD